MLITTTRWRHMVTWFVTQVQMQKPSQAKLDTKDGFDVKVPNNLVTFLVNLHYIPPRVVSLVVRLVVFLLLASGIRLGGSFLIREVRIPFSSNLSQRGTGSFGSKIGRQHNTSIRIFVFIHCNLLYIEHTSESMMNNPLSHKNSSEMMRFIPFPNINNRNSPLFRCS